MATTNKPNPKRRNTPLYLMGGSAIVLALVFTLGAAGGWFSGAAADPDKPNTAAVEREDLVIGVTQNGQLEASNKVIVRSLPRGEHEISWLIEEGSIVEPGDVIVRLDTTGREERLLEQQQRVESGRSAEITARVNYENTVSQSHSNVEQATLALEFAELDLKKYLEGEYPQELKRAQADVEIARESYKRAADKAEWSRKLAEKGYITDSEAEADIASARKAKLDMDVAEGKLDVLVNYTYSQQKRKLESDVDQKRAELERVKKKAEADVLRTEVDWKSKQAQYELDSRELERDREDLKNCIIRAPVAGRVVYAPQGNHWRQEEPLAAGQTVRQDQEIIHLPESGAMSVAIKIDETQRDKVAVGMPVRLTGPNLPRAGLNGTLEKIAEYLDPSGWWNNNSKVYSATVRVNDGEPVEQLRTGMNCQAEIIVAQYDNVLTLPLQCVTMVDDQHVVYVPDQPKPRMVPVKIGLDNGRKVHIVDGLREGDEVLLEPPLAPSTRKPRGADGKRPERSGGAGGAATQGGRGSDAQGQGTQSDRPAGERPQGERRQRPPGERPQGQRPQDSQGQPGGNAAESSDKPAPAADATGKAQADVAAGAADAATDARPEATEQGG